MMLTTRQAPKKDKILAHYTLFMRKMGIVWINMCMCVSDCTRNIYALFYDERQLLSGKGLTL